MKEHDLYQYYRTMEDLDFILSFKGIISQDILASLGTIIESRMSRIAAPRKTVRKLFAIVVELSQNILHHSDERIQTTAPGRDAGTGMVMLSEQDACYTITSGNMVSNYQAAQIAERCRLLNRLDREGLKRLYLAQRRKPLNRDAPRAELGMIDIARKADHPIGVVTHRVDDARSFLVMSVLVDKDGRDG